jgi:hypothetical protein
MDCKLTTMNMQESSLLQKAANIQSLAHLHTGRIEDLIDIVESIAPDGLGGTVQPRTPPPSSPPNGPPMNGGVMEGGGDQGPF